MLRRFVKALTHRYMNTTFRKRRRKQQPDHPLTVGAPARVGRPEADEGLRLPACGRDYLAPRWHATRETARRLGHSVETLVSTFVGGLDDEEHIANQRIDTYLQPHVPEPQATGL